MQCEHLEYIHISSTITTRCCPITYPASLNPLLRRGILFSRRLFYDCDQRVCMSVCLSVSPLSYLKNHKSKFHQIFCTCYICGRGSVLLWRLCCNYVLGFCGWYYVFTMEHD